MAKEQGTLGERYPRLRREFISVEGREEVDFDELATRDRCRWRCEECGHEWIRAFGGRTRGGGCSACAHLRRRTPKDGESLSELHPDVAAEFLENLTHPGWGPNRLKRGSGDRCRWRCLQGHPDYEAVVSHRAKGDGCGKCTLERRWTPPPGGSLADLHPELATELLEVLGRPDLGASALLPKSSLRCRWRCRRCSHEWEAEPYSRARGRGCSPCAVKNRTGTSEERRNLPIERQMLTQRPDMAAQFVQNHTAPGVGPSRMGVASKDLCTWQCRCGAEVVSTAILRSKRAKLDCQKCGHVSGTSLFEAEVAAILEAHTGLEIEQDCTVRVGTRNERLDLYLPSLGWYEDGPRILKPRSKATCVWMCDCGNRHQTAVAKKVAGGTCKSCGSKRGVAKQLLAGRKVQRREEKTGRFSSAVGKAP